MKIENQKIHQEELDRILANAGEEDLAFVDCNISNVNFNNRIGDLSFESCTVNRIFIDGANMDIMSISDCMFTSLSIIRSCMTHLVLNNFHTVDMFVTTATIEEIGIGENFTVEYCVFTNACVSVFEKLHDDIYAEVTEDDLPQSFVEAVRYDSKSMLPEEGAFIAYKKVYCQLPEEEGAAIATLLIPEDAERVAPVYSRKCRASKAKVLSITTLSGDDILKAHSIRNSSFVYEVGKTVVADKFNKNVFVECSNGIHFFIRKKDAKRYGWM